MSPLHQSLFFIVSTLGSFFILSLLLRFLLQAVRADFYNPLSQAIIKITSPVLHPVRRLIPGFRIFDMAALVLAIVFEVGLIYLLEILVRGYTVALALPFSYICMMALYRLANLFLDIYLYGLIVLVIASWVAPYSKNPALMLICQLTNPITQRVRRVIPPIGGLDFSIMIIVFIIITMQNGLSFLLH